MNTLMVVTIVVGCAHLPLASSQLNVIGHEFEPGQRGVYYRNCHNTPAAVTLTPNLVWQCTQMDLADIPQSAMDCLIIPPPPDVVAQNSCRYFGCKVEEPSFGQVWQFEVSVNFGTTCDVDYDKALFLSGSPTINCDCP